MKITKYVHSCLLVEMPEPVNRTALFDPGIMSEATLNVDALVYLDDIIITHAHSDHLSIPLVKILIGKFPEVRITAAPEVVNLLAQEGIPATSESSEGVTLFEALHEDVRPLSEQPEQIAVHYLDTLTHPGDSHGFDQTKPILALPVTAPWGSTMNAVKLATALKPTYVLPIHDWHWSHEARTLMYDKLEDTFNAQGITFVKLVNGEPTVIDLA